MVHGFLALFSCGFFILACQQAHFAGGGREKAKNSSPHRGGGEGNPESDGGGEGYGPGSGQDGGTTEPRVDSPTERPLDVSYDADANGRVDQGDGGGDSDAPRPGGSSDGSSGGSTSNDDGGTEGVSSGADDGQGSGGQSVGESGDGGTSSDSDGATDGNTGGGSDGNTGGGSSSQDGGGQSGGGDDQTKIAKESFAVPCDNTDTVINYRKPRDVRVEAAVSGEFCPTQIKKLTVLFIVDYSGSMGRHVAVTGTDPVPGNDPQTSGSCGRLQAAQAIVNKIKAEMSADSDVTMGMIPFASGVLAGRQIGVTFVSAFSTQVTKDHFCQYVVQGPEFGYDPQNPGGIDGGSVNSSTNYKAAFAVAESLLTNITGRKVIYFISDGEPTSGGSNPISEAEQAGQKLRDNVANLTFNSLLLKETEGSRAYHVMKLVSGSANRVRIATKAEELVDEITKFPKPNILVSSGKARLFVSPYPEKNLGLNYLRADSNRANVWVYKTQPFVLLGLPGKAVENKVTVTADGTDGSTHKSTIIIRYFQE